MALNITLIVSDGNSSCTIPNVCPNQINKASLTEAIIIIKKMYTYLGPYVDIRVNVCTTQEVVY